MIDADPLFVDLENKDYHLTFESPCRDEGYNVAIDELFDFEGDPRKADGNVEMGADEFYTHFYCTGDFTPNGLIEGKLVGEPGTAPTGIFFGVGVLETPYEHKWGDFYLEAPWFVVGSLGDIPPNGVMVIPTFIPANPPAPYDIIMQALIGEQLTNLFVLEVR